MSTESDATSNSHVRGYVGDGSTLTIAGNTTVSARNTTKQQAVSSSNQGGGIAVGAVDADAFLDTITHAYLGQYVHLTGGSLDVSALGVDNNFAKATPSGGGVIGISSASTETRNTSSTVAKINDSAVVDLLTDQDRDGIIDSADADQNGNGIADNVDTQYVTGADTDNDHIVDTFDFSVAGRQRAHRAGRERGRYSGRLSD